MANEIDSIEPVSSYVVGMALYKTPDGKCTQTKEGNIYWGRIALINDELGFVVDSGYPESNYEPR